MELSNSEIHYLAEKVFVHRWPHDTPLWGDDLKKQLDESINKNPEKKEITVKNTTIKIENFEFHSLKKVGVSVPFFKDQCTIIFESQFENKLFAHVHITTKSRNFLNVFNQLILWRQNLKENP